jgi:hypothetical protein
LLKTQHRDVARKSYGCINNSCAPEGINIMLDKKQVVRKVNKKLNFNIIGGEKN